MLTETCQAIADAISLRMGGDVQVKPYELGNPTPPSVSVFPGPVDYDKAMQRGLDEWTFIVRAFVAETSDVGSQTRLHRFLEPSGDESIKEAVEVDSTLGGLIDDVTVQSASGVRRYQRADGGVLIGADWQLRVYAKGA